MALLRILSRKSDRMDPMAKLDGELHVIVSRSTTVSAENGNIATLPSTSARVTAAKESKVAVSRRPTERREPLAQVAEQMRPSTPRVDERMHVLVGRPPPAPLAVSSPTSVKTDKSKSVSTPTSSTAPVEPRVRESVLPPLRPTSPPSSAFSSPLQSATPSLTHEEVQDIISRAQPPPVQEPPLAVALCISEVLNIPDVHSLAESIQSRPESRPDSDVLPRLAVKAKSLLDDNARMQSELQSLQEERVDLESQLQSVQAAMANMVRVAEIMNMRSRFTPSSANPTQNILLAGRGSFCAGCGTACAKCSDTSPPPTRTRWSMQMKDAVPKHDDGRNRLRILPPPRRVSRASSSEAMNSPALVPPDSPSIHLGEADCGVSLNRFRQSDDDENTDDEAGVGEQVAEDVNVNQKRVSIADSSEPTCNDKSSDTTVMVCECHSSTTTVADHDVDSPPMVDTDDTDATTVDEESTDDAHRVKPQPDGYPWW